MEKIEPGKYVEMVYDVYAVEPEGDVLVHEGSKSDPEKIIFGVTKGVFVPLEKALEGLSVGDKFDVKISPEESFGMRDPERVVTLEKAIFNTPEGKFDAEHVRPGAYLPMNLSNGYQVMGLVTEVGDDNVTKDFNHPMAGQTTRFVGTVETVRDATPEELQPSHGCCGGCGSNGCGSEGCGGGCEGGCGGCD